jgi:hypothetical protein
LDGIVSFGLARHLCFLLLLLIVCVQCTWNIPLMPFNHLVIEVEKVVFVFEVFRSSF